MKNGLKTMLSEPYPENDIRNRLYIYIQMYHLRFVACWCWCWPADLELNFVDSRIEL